MITLGGAWNPKQAFINGCLVISNHFLCKDLVHHPIETSIYKWLFGVPGGFKHFYFHTYLGR